MNELILIVDDEEGILTTMSQVLGDEGYHTLTTTSGSEALELYREHRPDVVFLDIWLPDLDGLEALQALIEMDPHVLVVMMSGHGTSATAVKSIKMGANDYLEKPLSYDQTVKAVRDALEVRETRATAGQGGVLEAARHQPVGELQPPPELPLLAATDRPQRTVKTSSVIYGLGLHSGGRTGMVLQPLPPDSGIHFITLPAGNVIPAHISAVAETDYATSITRSGEHIRTVEHLLSALHACGITNLLVKVHGEIPVLDGSALGFLDRVFEIGVEEQDRPAKEIVIDRVWEVGDGGEKRLTIEPAEVFSVSYLLRYPKPIGEQFCEFTMDDCEAYREQIAPARTFGFVKDIKMLNELGLGGGGRLDNFIMVGEDEVVNTELRFPDEFVRHKILDVIGDLYLLGYPVRGKVTARLTGHRDNIALQRKILADLGA
ncbi:MAG: UDP-3-O-acyl-N-acetylglucosamine deacetylase [Thermoanaerobaculales bacterium]|jgi:UDP-3-O-acyl N-acetylglucosamine deacetylase|nr:UDP-3-O-acyl-N-acetylglucosamine deacetylase [Thermoanaerobaculales bacterium]